MRYILLTAALLLVASCDTTPPIAPSPEISYQGAPFAFNVGHITVADDYVTPHRPPNVEYLSDFPPALAVRKWATARLIAAGHTGRLEVDIKTASIIDTQLPKQNDGISGIFTKDQTERLDGTLEVTLKIYDDTHLLPIGHVDADVHESSTLREDASLSDRRQAYHDMSVSLINALDAQMSGNIHNYFARYLL